MTFARRPLVAGNWKMNGLSAALAEIDAIAAGFDPGLRERIDLLICPPATLLMAAAARLEGTDIALGGQDCYPEASGAHTGDLSASMLADAGARFVIVGHSERRADHAESDAVVLAKARAALSAGLTPIVCIGETRAERESGLAKNVVATQIARSLPPEAPAERLVVAYEPVWAIGTGLTPTPQDVARMHAFARQCIESVGAGKGAAVRILYGGSVRPDNAPELLHVDDVDGALVGGASLKAKDFLAIAATYR